MSGDGRDPLRVLINALSARLGGGQTYVMNLLTFLPEEAAVEIFVLAPDSLQIPTNRANVRRIPVRWPVSNPLVRAAWEMLRLPKLLKHLNADVLYSPGGIIGARVPKNCRSVTMFRNMLPFDPVQSRRYPLGYMRVRHWMLKRVLLKSMKEADLVIFLSEYGKRVIERHAGGPLKRTVTISHGVNPVFRSVENSKSPRSAWLPPGDYLLYVSNVDFYKSQLEVVRAYAKLKQRRECREKLVLVGTESPEYGRMVHAEIGRLGLKNDIVVKGQVPHTEMPALYQHAVLNIFASQCENCPNILLEAMAAGRPVIVSNRPPMPEFAGNAALYFDPASPSDLAEKLATVLDNPAYLGELATKAREQSLLYDWQSTARDTWNVLAARN
jgi:glycosyltransferase involved in cell wall biosynthesis